MPKPTSKHVDRIRKELIEAGVSPIGMIKAEARYLPHVIHEDEEIGGVITGWYENGSAMLIATNRRIVFLDKKPIYTTKEEVTYDVVSGVRVDVGGISTVVTLHTRIKDFVLKYCNPSSARKFIQYVEKRQLEVSGNRSSQKIDNSKALDQLDKKEASFPFLTYDARWFLENNSLAVLSTKDKSGKVAGAVVYYIVDQLDRVYFLTKNSTQKAKNILSNPQVAMTIVNEAQQQTLQIDGQASVVSDQQITRYVFSQITRPRDLGGEQKNVPVVKIDEGSFVVFKVDIISGKYSNFSKQPEEINKQPEK